MMAWLQALQPRERFVLLAGAALLLALLGYALIWEPLAEDAARLREDVARQRELVAWMRQTATEAARLRGSQTSQQAADPRSLVAIVDAQVRSAGLSEALKRMQPTDRDGVRLEFSGATFDDLARWLGNMHREFGIELTSLTLEAGERPGRVDARMSMEREAS